MKFYYVYIIECSDKSYYTGITNNLEERIVQHELGYVNTCYTFKRRPLKLVYSIQLDDINQAIALEKQIKGWSRNKKQAFINEDWSKLKSFQKIIQNLGRLKIKL
jgi:putative endonuclease